MVDVYFSDKAWFFVSGYVKNQKSAQSAQNPHKIRQHHLHGQNMGL